MSVLGEFRRIDPGALAAIRAAPEQAFDLIDEIGKMLDVDRAWQRLGR